MDRNAADAAIAALVAARRTRTPLAALPDGSHPADLAEAHALQDATVAALGERVAGWKVAVAPDGAVMRGVILGSRMLASPASIPAADVPLLGIEAEIGFLFTRDLPPSDTDYSAETIASAADAVVGIEIVASRFADYAGTPVLDRAADCMSNGAYVTGTRRADWRATDLSTIEVVLRVNDGVVVQRIGGHAAGDPLQPAVALVNALRGSTGVRAGQLITTGTYTGLIFAKPGDAIAVAFTGFGEAAVTLAAR